MPQLEMGGLAPDAKPAKRLATLAFVCLLQALVSVAEQPAYQHGISLLHELKYPLTSSTSSTSTRTRRKAAN